MPPMLARALALAVLLGWAVLPPLPVAAKDVLWWHPMFGGSGSGTGADSDAPKALGAAGGSSGEPVLVGGGSRSSSSGGAYADIGASSNDDKSRTRSSNTDGDKVGFRGAGSGDDDDAGGAGTDASSEDDGDGGGSDSSDDVGSAGGGGDDDGESSGGVACVDNGDSSSSSDDDSSSSDKDSSTIRAVSGANGTADAAGNNTGTGTSSAGGGRLREDPSRVNDWEPEDTSCPRTNLTRLPRQCMVLRRICAHQETLVTHDWRYSYGNPRREQLPEFPWVENWNFPAAVGTNTDALKGRGPRYRLHLRPASGHEPTPSLRDPVFSNCTLPLIIVADFPFNMGEFFAKIVPALDQLEMDDRVSLVLQTPMGLGLAAFHSLLLMPYSRYPAITAAELGSPGCGGGDPRVGGSSSGRGGRGRAVPWSSEPLQPHCFQRLIMCKWDLKSGGGTPLAMVASRVVGALRGAGLLPPSPVKFRGEGGGGGGGAGGGGGRGASASDPDPRGSGTLRVLIESRQGPVRNIKNLEALLEACKEMERDGFSAGPFRHITCAATSFSDADGSVDHARFLANVAAVRSAHVLVVLHGAGATNSWFMRQGSSALVELRPCGFGTHFSGWPDKYMPKQHERNDDVIRFFALNVEDQGQCLQGDIEASLRNHTARRDNVGWDAAYFARDQHLALKPGPFLEFVRHVGELLLDVQAYRDARDADRLHGYVVPEGLMYGKLGIPKLIEFRAAENPPIIPFP